MNNKIPKPMPRGCPSGPVLPLLTSCLLDRFEATEAHGPDGFNPLCVEESGL
jgi:hypothetical protein